MTAKQIVTAFTQLLFLDPCQNRSHICDEHYNIKAEKGESKYICSSCTCLSHTYLYPSFILVYESIFPNLNDDHPPTKLRIRGVGSKANLCILQPHILDIHHIWYFHCGCENLRWVLEHFWSKRSFLYSGRHNETSGIWCFWASTSALYTSAVL